MIAAVSGLMRLIRLDRRLVVFLRWERQFSDKCF